VPPDQYERAVSLAASLAVHFASGVARISYWLGDAETRDLDQFLSGLALVEPAPAPLVLEKLPVGLFYLVVSARGREVVPPALLRSSIVVPAN
jgi:hypothetical protein